jgi:uncharacterized tellurite resistance protein B-like protein
MNIDTASIRRLRDSLLSRGQDAAAAPGTTLPASQREALLARIEPFAETMYLVMVADTDTSAVERLALHSALDVLTGGALQGAELGAMLERFGENLQREGSEARLQRIGARLAMDREDRETAWTLAAVVALADGQVEPGEHGLLEWVREYFGISDRRARALLEVVD